MTYLEAQRNMMVALINGKIDNIPLNKVINKEKKLSLNLMKLAKTLAS